MHLASKKGLLPVKQILHEMDVAEGMRIADFGCGASGHIVFSAADLVGDEGEVYAIDLQKLHLDSLRSLCGMRECYNIHLLWGDFEKEEGIRIPAQTLDRIFCIHNFHDITSPAGFFDECRRLLRPQGKLCLIDWKEDGRHPVSKVKKLTYNKNQVLDLAKEHGFIESDSLKVPLSHWALSLIPA